MMWYDWVSKKEIGDFTKKSKSKKLPCLMSQQKEIM